MSELTVRAITVADYSRVVAILNESARQPTTVEAWLAQSAQPDLRLVVQDQQGTILDYGTLGHQSNRWRLSLHGHPERVASDVREGLYQALERAARERGALELDSYVADHLLGTRQFLEHKGYQLENHYFKSQLDLADFDPEPYLALKAKAEGLGYRFHALSELPPEGAQRAFYTVDIECAKDEPDYRPDAAVIPFERYVAETFTGADHDPRGLFLATKEGEWAGVTGLRCPPGSDLAWTFFTGVMRAHRGAGLSAILKALGAVYARSKGYKFVGTSNHSGNPAMLHVNRRMGFVPTGGSFDLRKALAD